MHPSHLIAAAFVSAFSAPSVVSAQGAPASAAIERAHQSDALRPGEWVWAPDVSPDGPVVVFVDLARQLATVYRNGVRIGVTTISSGRRSYETPTGVFTVTQKKVHHRSNRYNNAPMPFFMRLTDDGIALHAGGLPGYPQSHGCVRMPYNFARQLFQVLPLHGVVMMTGAAGEPVDGVGAGLLAPIDADGATQNYLPLDNTDYRWSPAISPDGPISIILSRASQQVVVLRDGVEIGRARASIPADEQATLVLTVTYNESGQPLWRRTGARGAGGEALPFDTVVSGVSVSRTFLAALSAELEPGATLLVTPAPIAGALPHTPAYIADESLDPNTPFRARAHTFLSVGLDDHTP